MNKIVARISKSSVLSARSCSLAGVIPHASYGLAAQLSLSLALYVEMYVKFAIIYHCKYIYHDIR